MILSIWKSVSNGILEAVKKFNLNKENILCIGITNQRETTCAFKKNGEPLYNAIYGKTEEQPHFVTPS